MNRANFDLSGRRVWVAGHKGMVGAALIRRLASEHCDILVAERREVDLTRQVDVERWLDKTRPDAIIMAAAKVGGILANDTLPADFIYTNTIMQANLVEAAHRVSVKKLMMLGSSCIYPRLAAQPIVEDALLTGPLEPTNEWYAVAKIAGIKLAQAYRRQYRDDFISAMPTNLFGPGDNFDLISSHVLPALIRKAHEAKLSSQKHFVIWGTGTPRREFLFVDDCADALVHLMKYYSDDQHVNVGSGDDISIYDLALLVAKVVGFRGEVVRDEGKPDGTPRKLMDSGKLKALGWTPKVGLEQGIRVTYDCYLQSLAKERNVG